MKRKAEKTHLSPQSRLKIEDGLNNGLTAKEIADILKRDPSNIRKEIKKHTIIKFPSSFNNSNPCKYFRTCNKVSYECYITCPDFIELNPCEKLSSPPHVCNGCNQRCRHVKYYYNAEKAETQYLETLSTSRNSLHYTELEHNVLNNDFYNLVIQTKSIYHSLIVINKMGFNFNIKSIYRQIKDGRLKLKSSDLPRTSIKRKYEEKDKTYKRDITGHTYEDYTEYKNKYPNAIEWQMDCVQGIIGKNEPVLLTLQIVEIKFLFMFKIQQQKANMVIEKLREFKSYFSIRKFNKLLKILLTDNGHEFIKLKELMITLPKTNIYYCHPYSSCEKGSIENNHELIRRVIPQGVSLTIYTQKDFNLLCSNINSLYRDELDRKCPFDLINKYVDKEILDKLGLVKINPLNVTLIPELLGDKNVNNIKKYLSYDEIKKAHITFKK